GAFSAIPFVWLRDNCPCAHCRHPGSGQRTHDVLDIPADLGIGAIDIQGGDVTVRWLPDGHASRYAATWLAEHDLSPGSRARRRSQRRLWGAEITSDLPHAHWSALESSPEAELQALDLLQAYGFVVLRDVPSVDGMVVRVGERIGHVRVTNYGQHFD